MAYLDSLATLALLALLVAQVTPVVMDSQEILVNRVTLVPLVHLVAQETMVVLETAAALEAVVIAVSAHQPVWLTDTKLMLEM